MKKILFAIGLTLALSACGGGGGQAPSNSFTPEQKNVAHTGLPYYEMTSGTYHTFSISNIKAAHWDAETKEIIVDSAVTGTAQGPGAGSRYLVEQYSTNTCADFPDKALFVSTYSFNNTGLPVDSPSLSSSLQDAFWKDSNGVAYLGETINGAGEGDAGEPVFSASPIAGEHVRVDETFYTGMCQGHGKVYEQNFVTDYYTIRNVAEWNGFKDVWLVSLVERPDSPTPIYYEYAYAREDIPGQHGGQVGAWCWTENPDYYSCGNYYQAIN